MELLLVLVEKLLSVESLWSEGIVIELVLFCSNEEVLLMLDLLLVDQ